MNSCARRDSPHRPRRWLDESGCASLGCDPPLDEQGVFLERILEPTETQ